MTTTHSPAQSDSTAPQAPSVSRPRLKHWLRVGIMAYSISILLLWLAMRFTADRWWPATVFLFGPRWICGLPLLVLVPMAAIWQRRLLWMLGLASLVILFPILGTRANLTSESAPYTLRVVTCNVNQLRYPMDRMNAMLASVNADVVAMQEVPYDPPPIEWPRDWHVVHFEKFIVASRYPVERLEYITRPTQTIKPLAVRFKIKMPGRDVQLFNLHLTTPREGLAAVLDRRRGLNFSGVPTMRENTLVREGESRYASDWVASFPGPTIVVGDFNTPDESLIFQDYWSWLEDAFCDAGFGFGYTKRTGRGDWTYGTRIDHILYTPPWVCVRAWLGPDVGSDHLPLIADLQ